MVLTWVKNILARGLYGAQDLTMVKSDPTTDKGEQTRTQIFESALQLFRERGFDSTTMQEIAKHAMVVKSAAYYYFPSKEAIVQAYYETGKAWERRGKGVDRRGKAWTDGTFT